MQISQQIGDILQLGISFKDDMLVDMYFYARGTKREEAASAAAEVSE